MATATIFVGLFNNGHNIVSFKTLLIFNLG